MTKAICFNCGQEKFGALNACKLCSSIPKEKLDLAMSLVLSEHLSSISQLLIYENEIKKKLRLSVPDNLITQAMDALKDSQLMAMLGHRIESDLSLVSKKSSPTKSLDPPSPQHTKTIMSSPRSIQTTNLHKNPFAILAVTTRDDRKKIVEQAEEKSLELDHVVCQKARSDLTNPRNRLSAEIAWLPGVSPRKATQLLEVLLSDPMRIRKESGLPTLAQCNLMAAAFEAVNANDQAEYIAEFIQELAYLADDLDLNDIVRDINEDRAISGFPEIRDDQIEHEILERKRFFRSAIKDALNRLPPESLLDAMTYAVDNTTSNGEIHAPELIDELVDSYAFEIQGVLEKEAENVKKLVDATRSSAKSGESAIKPLVDKIEKVARNWDRFAQPIQLSAKARGIDHNDSNALAYSIRSLAIDLFNNHDMLESSQRLTILIQELFAELPEVAEQVEQDVETLFDIYNTRMQAEAQSKKREAEWARAITFSAEVGLVFKDILSISPEGIVWKGNQYPLEAITGVRWGSIRHSVNGIPSGTDYTIALATRKSSTVISLNKESIYSGFIDALWRAVCFRLIIDICDDLKKGQSLSFGDILVQDGGVTITKHKLLGSNDKVRLTWKDVHVWSANGDFVIASKFDKKIYSSSSYINNWNTHLLDYIVRAGFKKGVINLSEYFND
jgi:hypothetical protein